MTMAPSLWSLAWQPNGELGLQDKFDLLQTLVLSESVEVQTSLIAAVESLSTAELSFTSVTNTTASW
ncbi:MAG: hypothetical protein NTZ40_13060 [Cyanobacteria bacterium]|jgi:hypothetical protein|nr:hypothetical protein [Cyanobacteriota bacterium]